MTAAQDESEYLTRRKRIDPLLRAQGWKIVPFDPARAAVDYNCHADRA